MIALALAAVSVFLCSSAPLQVSAEPNMPAALVEIRIIQYDPNVPAPPPDPALVANAVVVPPGPFTTRYKSPDPKDWQYSPVVPRGCDLLIDGHLLPARRPCDSQPAIVTPPAAGRVREHAPAAGAVAGGAPRTAPAPAAESAAWREIVAPRVLAYVGQTATVSIGAKVPYMVKRADGSLVLEQGEPEGVNLDVRIGAATPDTITLEKLELKLTEVTGRTPIPDVPFEVGKPVYSINHMSIALRLATDRLAVIRVPDAHVCLIVGAQFVADPADDARPSQSN